MATNRSGNERALGFFASLSTFPLALQGVVKNVTRTMTINIIDADGSVWVVELVDISIGVHLFVKAGQSNQENSGLYARKSRGKRVRWRWTLLTGAWL